MEEIQDDGTRKGQWEGKGVTSHTKLLNNSIQDQPYFVLEKSCSSGGAWMCLYVCHVIEELL